MIPGSWQHVLIYTLLGAVAIGFWAIRPRRKGMGRPDRSVRRASYAEFQEARTMRDYK